jgi:hypothetical protein
MCSPVNLGAVMPAPTVGDSGGMMRHGAETGAFDMLCPRCGGITRLVGAAAVTPLHRVGVARLVGVVLGVVTRAVQANGHSVRVVCGGMTQLVVNSALPTLTSACA